MNEIKIYDDEQARNAFSIANLLYNPEAFAALQSIADMFCSQSGVVPEHLQKNKGDMMAIIMQAGRWGLDPLMVAQCTFSVNGVIGYEAKLMQAIVKSNGNLWFNGEYYGPWEKIIGNTRLVKVTKKGKYGDYQVDQEIMNWTQADEKGVGYIIRGHFPCGRVEEMDIPLISCKPRHSTNWVYDPRQQIHYTGVKRFVRRFAPHLAVGVKDYDDVMASTEKEINPTPKAETSKKSVLSTICEPSECEKVLLKIKKVDNYDDYDNIRDYAFDLIRAGNFTESETQKVQDGLAKAIRIIEGQG